MSAVAVLEEAFRRCFGADPQRSMRPVSTGDDNRSWLVTFSGNPLVAKLPERRGGLTAGSGLEYEILARAAAAGITPRPVGFDSHTGVLFVELIAGGSELTQADALNDLVIERIARTMRVLNAIEAPPELRPYDPELFAAEYAANTRSVAAARLHAEIRRLHAGCVDVLAGNRLCHNDLHAGNILIGDHVWFVDFEYAVRAAPIVDIASFAAFNDLDIEAAANLARCCLGDALPFSVEQLDAVIRIQRLLGELWEIARSDNNAPE